VSVDFSDIPRELLAFSLRTLGVVLIILVFTGAVIGLYLYAIVIKPVWRIVEANQAAARGDRANAYVPAHEIPDDEIGDIARTRHELLAVIEQHSQDLEAVILRGISDPIALLDAGRKVLLRNRPAVPEGDGCGCEVHRLLPAMPMDACPVARTLETGVPVSLAFAVEGPEGTRYHEAFTFPLAEGRAGASDVAHCRGPHEAALRGVAWPPADEAPRARRVIELVRDVTERYRLEEAARRCERLAVVGELAAGMAHEIRNPLASIVASVDLLDLEAGRPVGAEGQVLLGVLKKEAKRINQLLTDFLKFARPRPLRLSRTDVNAILRGVGELTRTHPKNGGRVLVREALDTSLPVIEADSDLLEQALLNIAINALEAMPQGGELSLVTAAAPEGGGGVEIAIADTGVGIGEKERERIFEPFHTTKPDGTGLGLAITYRVVEQHGGSIAVDSQPGAGTTVRVRLPRAGPPAGSPPPGRDTDRRPATGSGSTGLASAAGRP
jgi:signal transduction histidine kinase/HAMP domain-containing protein